MNSVDLPAPFGPITERISRSRDVEGDVVDGDEPAEALGEVFDLEERGHRVSPPPPARAEAEEAVRQDQHQRDEQDE